MRNVPQLEQYFLFAFDFLPHVTHINFVFTIIGWSTTFPLDFIPFNLILIVWEFSSNLPIEAYIYCVKKYKGLSDIDLNNILINYRKLYNK